MAILTITFGYVFSGRMGLVPMPRVDSNFSSVTVALPYGSPIENTRKVQSLFVRTARELGDEITKQDKAMASYQLIVESSGGKIWFGLVRNKY